MTCQVHSANSWISWFINPGFLLVLDLFNAIMNANFTSTVWMKIRGKTRLDSGPSVDNIWLMVGVRWCLFIAVLCFYDSACDSCVPYLSDFLLHIRDFSQDFNWALNMLLSSQISLLNVHLAILDETNSNTILLLEDAVIFNGGNATSVHTHTASWHTR